MKIFSKIKGLFKESVAETEAQRIARQIDNGQPPYTICKNCGTELQGMYCHKCGQYASKEKTLLKDFILEYFKNTYPLDSQIIPTIWHLIRRPGYLTKEFFAGKHNSYVHPLKLNMFFLFVVVTVLLIFAGRDITKSKMMETMGSEAIVAEYEFTSLINDSEYALRMKDSPRDTVNLLFPSITAETHGEFMTLLEKKVSPGEFDPDTLLAVIPSVLIEDGFLIVNDDSYYVINKDFEGLSLTEHIDSASKVWDKMVGFLTQYLPLIILFTCPFLARMVRLFNYRKRQISYMQCFVFTLHYTAFLEIFLFILSILSLLLSISGSYFYMLTVVIVTNLYLTLALKRVFEDKHVVVSVLKSLMINLLYLLLIFIIIFILFFVSILLSV